MLDGGESTIGIDSDMGDGSVPVAGSLVEDHQECDERQCSVDITEHVRYLVAADLEERGYPAGSVCEDLRGEHEPGDGGCEVVCRLYVLRHSRSVDRPDEAAGR